MSTITLPNIRVSSDLTIRLKLKDGGVAIDWSTLQNIRVSLYADDQRSMASRCNVSIDEEDSTILVCQYAANKMQYLGVNRVIVQCKYMGEVKTYDKPAFNFVRWTSDQEGEQITIDDPDVDVEISVEDISSSILQEAVDAAFSAADRANEAAEAAEHMVDIHTGPEGKSAYEVAVEEGYTGTEEEWLASLKGPVGETPDISIGTVTTVEPGTPAAASMSGTPEAPVLNLSIPKGAVGATPNFTVGTVTTGQPGTPVVITITGTAEAPVLNVTIPQGLKGDTGVSADYPITIHNGLDSDATDEALAAAQGKILDDKVSQLEAEVNGEDISSETTIAQSLTAGKYYNTNGTIPNSPSNKTGCYCAKISVSPGEKYRVKGVESSGVATRLWCTADSERARVSYASTGDGTTRNTVDIDIPESGVAYLVVNLVDYDSQTDGFWKVVSTSTHQDGLVDKVEALDERVEALEDAPALNVIDSLDSESATDPLSANQGRVINEEINGVTTPTYTDQPLQANKYFNTQNSRVPAADSLADATGTYAAYIFVTPGEVYRIYGKGDSGVHQLYAMADADRYVVQDGIPGVAMNTRSTPLDLTIPEGVARLVVNLYQYDSATDKVQKVGSVTSESIKTRIDALEGAKQLALPLMGKKVMFFGDSITDYTYNQKGLVNYFADASLSSCYKAAIGGTRFVQRTTPVDTPTTNNEAYAALDICNMVKAWCEANYTKQDAATTFLNDHTARVNALKNNPIGGVDIVCIGGGTNDMSSSSPIGNDSDNDFTTIKGSINKMVELLLTANPKLKIYFYSPVVGYHGSGGRTDANWDDNHQFSSGLTKPQYIEIFAERAKKNHIPYIDIYWTLGWNQTNFSTYFLDSDDHHPYKGFDVIGRRLYQQVVTNLE